ncbi:MAG: response regulator, partial [Pseudomonadota bacterium]
MSERCVLVVDDDEGIRHALADTLGVNGFRVLSAQSAEQAVQILETKQIDLVLTDMQMGAMDGAQL